MSSQSIRWRSDAAAQQRPPLSLMEGVLDERRDNDACGNICNARRPKWPLIRAMAGTEKTFVRPSARCSFDPTWSSNRVSLSTRLRRADALLARARVLQLPWPRANHSDATLSPHILGIGTCTIMLARLASAPSSMTKPIARAVISASAVDLATCACLTERQSMRHSPR